MSSISLEQLVTFITHKTLNTLQHISNEPDIYDRQAYCLPFICHLVPILTPKLPTITGFHLLATRLGKTIDTG